MAIGGVACSIVVAAHGTGGPLARCLAAYAREAMLGDEILVVIATDRNPGDLDRAEPSVRFLKAPAKALTPRLWALGLAEAHGQLVQVTIAPCVPQPGWRAAVSRAHDGHPAAVGGAIEPGGRLRLRDWAIWFLRYRAYLLPFDHRRVRDVPGDNATYLQAALEETRALWRDEFWEYEVNAELARTGRLLLMDPWVVVRYEGGEKARALLRQRFWHGVRFGRMRLVGAPRVKRLLFVAASFLPGVLLFAKVAGSVFTRRRHRIRFLASLPWIFLFLLAWSGGEWWGYLLGAPPLAKEEGAAT